MTRTDLIAELERERVAQELTAVKALSRIDGIDAQLKSLKAGVGLAGELGPLARTDAILTVLRSSGEILSPTEVLLRLNAAGRDDDRQVVTATLKYLLSRNLVRRPSRGHYFAA
ncbi:MAG: hypothetical protein HKL85_03370 [Acidimicrobiaceae bacterium]|nr:hypothetical protein [Acidimicrobiaceae bacterium]